MILNGRLAAQAAAARPSVAPRASRSGASRRRPQPFKGARTAVLVQAAAEPTGEAPKQQQRQRRAPRAVTVQMTSIEAGQELEGTVSSVETYGAFVNVGAESDGLVHVSQLTDGYVKNVADVIKVGDKVKVKVLTVDAGAKRLALTMKGMGNAAPARGGKGGPVEASFEEEAGGDAEDDGFALEAGDVALDGLVFRVDDDAADGEGYDEADEFEAAADAEVALAALEASIIKGKVASVEDFGVVVEWADAKGAKQSGLLHVSEMRAPASAAAAELGAGADGAGADGEGEGDAPASFFADEGEYTGEQYADVGGVDKPSRYYNVGDAISCFVLSAAGRKVELTQDLESLALDGGIDEEGEAGDEEEARALARIEAGNGGYAGPSEDDEGEAAEVYVADAGETSASIYYGQSTGGAKNAGAPAFIRGKRGSAVAPGAFPSRGYSVADADLRVAAASRLVDIDDAGDEAELVDYWSNDLGSIGRRGLAAFGAKIVANEEGELVVVPREEGDAAAAAAAGGAEAAELLAGVSDRDLDDLVDMLLGEEEDEAEVPFLARRNPGTMARR
ncbi:hypothetical protein Rsub_07219 [Raphidocelis subcapitata]|uniref:S1 motif domain-containing protein n=1 Tax=Raphidocelis subcapitata TaxID=307507 RepID=A0A2V0PBD2_9CHLO|nr:hypothetical protein Rsub_07219 [Raphidocelis subcapitata]|eukprot:GBF94405.1 hypothetical protein Rsub_07219 [Raphidocelis subcapitata]